MNKQLILFTDLDGTLLDSRYSFRRALSAVKEVKKRNIPLILCSSKTKAEIEKWRKKLNNDHPFISENGGGIFIPRKYFGRQVTDVRIHEENNYDVIKLGAAYSDLRHALSEVRSDGFDVRGFGDMKVKEVAELTGLTISDARLAKKRDFDEPFLFPGNLDGEKKLKRRIKSRGFHCTQGEFFHIMGDSDKGRAVEILTGLYRKTGKQTMTIALGDSPNDIEMLQRVDFPVVVKKGDGSYHPQVVRKVKGVIKADGVGPEGWNRAVSELLETLVF